MLAWGSAKPRHDPDRDVRPYAGRPSGRTVKDSTCLEVVRCHIPGDALATTVVVWAARRALRQEHVAMATSPESMALGFVALANDSALVAAWFVVSSLAPSSSRGARR